MARRKTFDDTGVAKKNWNWDAIIALGKLSALGSWRCCFGNVSTNMVLNVSTYLQTIYTLIKHVQCTENVYHKQLKGITMLLKQV